MDGTVVFSPSGRYACRQGTQVADDTAEGHQCFHIVDFHEEACCEFIADSYSDYIIACLYWLDENHIAAVYMQKSHNVGSFFCRKRILYEVNFDERKLEIIRNIEWNVPSNETRYMYACEGTLILHGEEFLVFGDDVCVSNKWKPGISLFRLIPKQFDTNGITHEKVVVNWMKAAKSVNFEDVYSEECTVVAQRDKLYFVVDGLNIIALNMEKYLDILRITGNETTYEDLCSKLTITVPGMICKRVFCRNGFQFLITMDRNESENLHLIICDIEKSQVSGLYKITGILNPHQLSDIAGLPNLSVHPSGQIVQFRRNNFEIQDDIVTQNKNHCQPLCRKEFLIKFCSTKLILADETTVKDLTKDYLILSKALDSSKLPLSLVDGKSLLILPIQKHNPGLFGLNNHVRRVKNFVKSLNNVVDFNSKNKLSNPYNP